MKEYEISCNVLLSLEQIVRNSDGWEDSAIEAVHNAVQTAIKCMHDRSQGEWNSLSDSIPVGKGYYLTTTINHEVYCDYWSGEYFDRTEAVIAWMPLPAPYMGKEQS